MVCNSAVTTADFADEHSAIVIVESLDDSTIVIVDCDSSVCKSNPSLFYEKLGFYTAGDTFTEAEIPHIHMEMQL